MGNAELAESLRIRTKRFALGIIRRMEEISSNSTSEIIKKQIIRSATSVGANYRSACRSRSKPDFIAKIRLVVEEADETLYWLELLKDLGILEKERYFQMHQEGEQLLAIFVTSIQTAQRSLNR
jgi:four helix bundle protein